MFLNVVVFGGVVVVYLFVVFFYYHLVNICKTNVLHSTSQNSLAISEEGRKEIFYLTTHSIHFIIVIWHQTYGRGPLI